MKHVEVTLRLVLDVAETEPGRTPVESTGAAVGEEIRAMVEELPDVWIDEHSAYTIRFAAVTNTKRGAPPLH